MPKITISAKEILADIKAGLGNAALMEKYRLSEKGLQSLFKKLVDSGRLNQGELERERLSLKQQLNTLGNVLLVASLKSELTKNAHTAMLKLPKPPLKVLNSIHARSHTITRPTTPIPAFAPVGLSF